MESAILNDVGLQSVENWLGERFQSVAFQVVEEGNAKLLLIVALDKSQIGLDGCPLVGLQVVEQVTLD